MGKEKLFVQAEDGLLALVAGSWAEEKHFFLRRFLDIFNAAMKGRWPSRVYVDLFAGPGKCCIRGTYEEVDGSPLLALRARNPFTHYYFNDIDEQSIHALKARVSALGISPTVSIHYYSLDCNAAVDRILEDLPPRFLGVAVIDQWAWELDFNSLTRLVSKRRIDLVYTLHTGSIKRTAKHVLDQLDRSLGGSEWRPQPNSPIRSRLVLDSFERKLKDLGYEFIDDTVVERNSQNLPLYHLVYASRHRLGRQFWEAAAERLLSGQRRLPLPNSPV